MGETPSRGPQARVANRRIPSTTRSTTGSSTRSPGADNGDGFGIDVTAERERTAGCRTGHHLNAAGAALPPREVVDTVVDHLRREELEGGYEAAAAERDRLETVYERAATLVGAAPDEIALLDSASTGLRVIVDALRLGPDDTVVMSRSAYVSHALHLMAIARERGVRLEVIDSTPTGEIDLDMLDEVLGRVPGPVVCPAHVPTSSGLVEPVADIGKLAAAHGARYVLDATQSVGQLPVDVDEIGCDALVTTGRKFLRGPRGTAFLYVRRRLFEALEPTAPDVRGSTWTGERSWSVADSARRFEVWESFVAGRLGLGVAIDQAIARGIDASAGYIIWLAARLRDGLAGVDGVMVVDPPAARSGIVTFVVDGFEPRVVVDELAARQVRVVSVPASHAHWDLGARGHDAVVRASVHVYNDVADIEALIGAAAELTAWRAAAEP